MEKYGRADDICIELRNILNRTRKQPMGPTAASLLSQSIESLAQLESSLEQLQTMIVLHETSPDAADMETARHLWETIEPGSTVTAPNELVSASPTLSSLHRAAVSIRSVQRFSLADIALATHIADAAGEHPNFIGMLNSRKDDRHPSFTIPAESVAGMERILRDLERAEAISGFKLQGLVEPKDGKPYWRDRSKTPKNWKLDRWRVIRGKVAATYVQFLGGDWLTAYAYGIAFDQFSRAGTPFEIYSKVEYTLPADQGGGHSDIDVLVRTAESVLCIECKTGRVLTHHNGEASALEHTQAGFERLDNILEAMHVNLIRGYQLLYLSPPGEHRTEVAAAGKTRLDFKIATPVDLRRDINEAVEHSHRAVRQAG